MFSLCKELSADPRQLAEQMEMDVGTDATAILNPRQTLLACLLSVPRARPTDHICFAYKRLHSLPPSLFLFKRREICVEAMVLRLRESLFLLCGGTNSLKLHSCRVTRQADKWVELTLIWDVPPIAR